MGLLLLVWSLVGLASAQDDVLARVLDGTPPTLDARAFAGARTELAARADEFGRSLPSVSGACGRFFGVVGGLARTIAADARDLELSMDEGMFKRRVRLEVLIPAFIGLQDRFARGVENGADTLDPLAGAACAAPDRAVLARDFRAVAELARTFLARGLGDPGLRGFDDQLTRLLWLASREGARNERLANYALVGAFAASVVFWEFAPAVAVVTAQRLGGVAGAIARYPLSIYATRVTFLTADGAAAHALNDHLRQEPRGLDDPRYLGSWSDQMGQLEKLIASPAAGELVLPLSLLQGQYALLLEPWLKSRAPHVAGAEARP